MDSSRRNSFHHFCTNPYCSDPMLDYRSFFPPAVCASFHCRTFLAHFVSHPSPVLSTSALLLNGHEDESYNQQYQSWPILSKLIFLTRCPILSTATSISFTVLTEECWMSGCTTKVICIPLWVILRILVLQKSTVRPSIRTIQIRQLPPVFKYSYIPFHYCDPFRYTISPIFFAKYS